MQTWRRSDPGTKSSAISSCPQTGTPNHRPSWISGRSCMPTTSPARLSAMYYRAEPRDFLDIDADMLATIDRYADRRFTPYGITPDAVADLRSKIADWREEIRQYLGESPRTVVRSP